MGQYLLDLLRIRQSCSEIAVVFQDAQKLAHRGRQFARHKMLGIVAEKYGVNAIIGHIRHVRHRADYVPAKRLALDIQPDFLPGIGIEAVPAQNVCAAGSDVEEALFVHDIF